MLKNLYTHRRFLFGSFWSEFRYRFAGSSLGIFWFVVNPILEAIIFSFVFNFLVSLKSQGLRGSSFTIYLLTGLFPWMAFSVMISQGSNALSAASLFLRRLSVTTDVYVAKESLIAMLSLAIYAVILIPVDLFFGESLSWAMLALPALIFLFVCLGFGISLIVSHLRVFFPDVGEVLGVLVQMWRWTLPINYPLDIMPEWAREVMKYNPPYYFIMSFRDIYLDGKLPAPEAWLIMFGWAALFVSIGAVVSKVLGAEVKDQM